MPDSLDVQAELRAAAERGYFDLSQLHGRYTLEQLRMLFEALDREHIPREPPKEQLDPLDRRTAVAIVNALRVGAVPQADLTPLSVGRTSLRRRLVDDLEEVGRGSARVRFLNAAYGSGKTHSLWLLAETAFRENFAVSFVTLRPGASALYSMLAVYGSILDGIHTSGSRSERGLQRLLDRWIEIIQRDGEVVARERIHQLAPYFVTALAEYAGARVNPIRQNHERQLLLLNYLCGKRTLLRDLRRHGIDQTITEQNALETLSEITALTRQLGFRGLCIFLDEAESVLSFTRVAQADQAYRNLLRIVQAGPRLRNCYFIYAATPSFFDSYGEYWGNVTAIEPSHIYALDPLSTDECRELGERIARIYGRAHEHPVPIGRIRDIVGPVAANAQDVGTFVRAVVAILDRERRRG